MFDTIVPASELQNLLDYTLYIRTLLDGRPVEPFLVQSAAPLPTIGMIVDAHIVVRNSLQRYGRGRASVEQR